MNDTLNLLIVVEKPSVERYVLQYLSKHPDIPERYRIYYDYFGCVMDTRSIQLPFYKHEDGWYLYGKPSGFTPMVLPDLSLPEDSYLEFLKEEGVVARNFRRQSFRMSETDEVWFFGAMFFDCCQDDILAARKYVEITGCGMEKCKYVPVMDFTESELEKGFARIGAFGELYGKTRQYLLDNGFPYHEPWDSGFERILCLSHMHLQEFCEYFHVKRRTAENWKYGKSECPGYVLDLMEYKLLHEGII